MMIDWLIRFLIENFILLRKKIHRMTEDVAMQFWEKFGFHRMTMRRVWGQFSSWLLKLRGRPDFLVRHFSFLFFFPVKLNQFKLSQAKPKLCTEAHSGTKCATASCLEILWKFFFSRCPIEQQQENAMNKRTGEKICSG